MGFISGVAYDIGKEVGYNKFYCPFCHKLISREAKVCPYCQREIPAENIEQNKQVLQQRDSQHKEVDDWTKIKAIIIVGAILLYVIFSFLGSIN